MIPTMEIPSHNLLVFLFLVNDYVLSVNCLFNAALYKPVWQSSTSGRAYAYFANDGSRLNILTDDGGCQHTGMDDPAWWMVDLQGQHLIEQVVLTNRYSYLDFVPRRLREFQIDVFTVDPRQYDNFVNISGDVCYNRTSPFDAGTFTLNCRTPVVGRFVRLIRYGSEVLHICELEVMSSQFSQRFTSFTAFLNLALNQSLSGSSYIAITRRQCSQQCLDDTSGSRCTAFNWNRDTNECQLFSIDTRCWNNVTNWLQGVTGVDFYMETYDKCTFETPDYCF